MPQSFSIETGNTSAPNSLAIHATLSSSSSRLKVQVLYIRMPLGFNVAWIAKELGADVLPVSIEADWGITGNLIGKDFPVYRFLPHRTKGEGFFLAVLRKHEGELEKVALRSEKKKKGKDNKQPLVVPKEAKSWLENATAYSYEMKDLQ